MVTEPADRPVATPREPFALLMLATAGVVDSHVTKLVMSKVVESESVPCAVKASVAWLAMLPLPGETVIAVSVAEETVTESVPLSV